MNLRKTVLKGIKWTTLSTIIIALCALFKISFLTRFLDKNDFGSIALLMFFLTFSELFNDMGLTSAILYKREITKNEYSSLYWLNLSVSIVLYLALLAFSPFLSNFYNQSSLTSYISIIGLSIIFSGFGRQFKVVEQKYFFFKTISLIETFGAVISLLSAVLFAYLNYGIYALIYSYILQYFFVNVFFVLFGLKKHKIHLYFRFKETIPFLKIGIYQVGGQIVNYFNRDLDILIIGKCFGADILGGYSLAKQLVYKPAQIINPIITKVASPSLALFQNSKLELKKQYLKLVNIVFVINLLAYSGVFVFSPFLVKFLYGSDYLEVVTIIRVLCFYMLLRAIGNPVGSLVIATGKTNLEFFWNLIVLVVIPIFIIAGVNYGIYQTTIFMTMSMVFLFWPSWYFLIRKMTGASLKEYLTVLNPLGVFPLLLTIKNVKD
ncbi:MOP flippase family protein [Flagellimonas sp. S174]|uniref:MOP flippase family protein n=1 Tax=Flagellimonas sp. S174 TaxID=3410790 RepID=UPI003BF45EFB